MTTISAQIIEDSISPSGARITTFQLKYPRWFHQELLTHRAFARNASSSRAIPVAKMLAQIKDDPAEPWHLGMQEPGMQARAQITDPITRGAVYGLWRRAMRLACLCAESMVNDCGVAKQVANRITEFGQHINVVLTATDFENFFALRCHPDAEPHFRVLAWRMADAYYVGSTPSKVTVGAWHLPYITALERASLPIDVLKACSAARCARVSYRLSDGRPTTVDEDLSLHQRLLAGLVGDKGDPGHLSPFEHQAMALNDPSERSGPFAGWRQYRKEIAGECARFDYHAAVAKGWREDAYSIVPPPPPQ